MLANHTKLIVLTIAAFICLSTFSMHLPSVHAAGPIITPDLPIVPIWNLGGKVNLTLSEVPINVTYYAWLQRPAELRSAYTGVQLLNNGRNGPNATFPMQVTVSSTDPAGTYTVSLSTAVFTDTNTAIAHFGVFGTDSRTYSRTSRMQIAGGGFSPNSTVSLNIQSGGQALSGFPINVPAGSHGDFSYTFRVPPSTPAAPLTVNATGPAYDTQTSTNAISAPDIRATTLTITTVSQPSRSVERTNSNTVAFSITYPDGSPVSTSTTNSTRVFIVSDATSTNAVEVPLVLSDSNTGRWQAAWIPIPSMELGSYHFEIFPTDFDDLYGNLGTGRAIVSQSFDLTPAKVALAIQGNATLQRTQQDRLVAVAQYHTNTPFTNVTRISGSVTDPNGAIRPLALNYTQNQFIGYYNTTVNSNLGQVLVSETVQDLYGNTASATVTIQIVKAQMHFAINLPDTAERTTILNVSAKISYPDRSTLLSPNLIPDGFNLTISQGNYTWRRGMIFNETTNAWFNGYPITQNATLGDYSARINLVDQYGNWGNFSGSSTIIPARFRFFLPSVSQRVSPGTLINVEVHVSYPNGSALSPAVQGVVTGSFSNSSGVFSLPLIFNATDRTWHMFYTAPDPGLRFGLTIKFSFSGDDKFGNTGSAAQAYQLDVGAGTLILLLATMIGAIPAIVLVGWAIFTVSARRRKHKP